MAVAGRLENTYFPLNAAHGSGGSGLFLTAPKHFGLHSIPTSVFNVHSDEQSINTANYVPIAHQYHSAPVPILRYVSQNNGDGTYQFE